MTKRILDACASNFSSMNAMDLKKSIQETEGRTISAEIICTYEPPIEGITNAEIAAAFGADIITLDFYDPDHPMIAGIPEELIKKDTPLLELEKLLGRPVAINMAITNNKEGEWLYTRRYSPARIDKAIHQGAGIIFLYGDPLSGTNLINLLDAVKYVKAKYSDEVMIIGIPNVYFPAPIDDALVSQYNESHKQILQAGAEGIGLVMPGSKQGWRLQPTSKLIDFIHKFDGLAWLIITGSVEGSPKENIQQIALNAKMIGGDVYRLDEAGLSGMPLPENILEFSLTIRGKRHTYRRMASSPLR